MDPPVCRTCGQKHWSRVCADVTPAVTPVTKSVTARPAVPVTPIADVVTQTRMAAEIAALTAEVAMLKRKLAEANKVPTTSTERMRKLRAKAKSV